MSAITGLFCRDGKPASRSTIETMTSVLLHRGSDGQGFWNEGPMAAGNLIRWTTPESSGEALPLRNKSGELILIADTRIDNRRELISALGLQDDSITDAALILEAYETWGEGCPYHMVGDFAFAVFNRSNRSIFCARDAMGVRPFYYFISDKLFAFASEMKGLFENDEVPFELNEEAVEHHLLSIFEDPTTTLYSGIRRLAPGHSLTVSERAFSVTRYWSLDPQFELRLKSDDDYAEAFREKFTEAVACRLRSSFTVGSSLSGGLDSSSIACTAGLLLSRQGRGQLNTYSVIFPDLPASDLKKIDEREFVKAVLNQGDFNSHLIRGDQLNPLTELDKMLWHQDQAILAPNLYLHWSMYSAAQADGVRVFLDGVDGDTTVSHGIAYLEELAARGRLFRLYREAKELSRKSPNAHFTPARIAWDFGIRKIIPESLANLSRRLRGRSPANDEGGATLLNRSFSDRVKKDGLISSNAGGKQRRQTVRQAHHESLNSPLIPYTLEVADKAAAAFGIEPRYPFFDRRLVEFCLALPPQQKLSNGWTRAVMRRAMSGILPPSVQWRIGKSNLSPNFKRRLIDCERELIERIVLDDSHLVFNYANNSAIADAYRRYSADPINSRDLSTTLFATVVLGRWLEKSQIVSGGRKEAQTKVGAKNAACSVRSV